MPKEESAVPKCHGCTSYAYTEIAMKVHQCMHSSQNPKRIKASEVRTSPGWCPRRKAN